MTTPTEIASAPSQTPPDAPELDREQRAAVEHGEGPLLVVAGAGTGKTTVIAQRIAALIASRRARPSEILALAFNDKAAAEMQERVDLLVPYGYADVTIRTFHSFGEDVLSGHGLEIGIAPGFTILDKTAQALFLAERLDALGLDRYAPLSDPTKYLSEISTYFNQAKDEPLWPDDLRRLAESEDGEERERSLELIEAFDRYNRMLWREGFVDFGDLLALTLRLFDESPATRYRFQEQFRYVLVDEFQDTNPVQFKIVRCLVEKHRNLVVVGDDDQSIYRFRGAHIQNILQFREHYPDAREIVLRRNYRSTREILEVSRRVIRVNSERLETKYGISKELVTDKTGPMPRYRELETETEEAAWVADEIAGSVAEGRRRWRDFAILVRNNKHAEPFLRALDERGVPYYFSGSRGLFQRAEVKEMIALLHSLYQETRPEYLYRLAGEAYGVPEDDLARLTHRLSVDPARFRTLLERAARGRAEVPVSEDGQARLAAMIADLEDLREFARGRRTGEVLYRYLDRRGILKDLVISRRFEDEARARNIVKFFSLIRSFEQVALSDRVPLFLRHLEAVQDYGEDPAVAEIDATSDVVQVLTIHKAKGLEFPVVYLVQLASDRFPTQYRSRGPTLPTAEGVGDEASPRRESESHREEERRLCYVALTRAREELILTFARDYGGLGKRQRKPSIFLMEAFDLGKPIPARKRRETLEMLESHRVRETAAPIGSADASGEAAAGGETGAGTSRPPRREPLQLSFRRLEDYETCPLKYRYLHELSVDPILTRDHRVNFGNAVHQAVAFALRGRRDGLAPELDEVLRVFRGAWRSEGYRNEEHERRRFEQGAEALRDFYDREVVSGPEPADVERHFRVKWDDVVVTGSIDRLDEGPAGITLSDYKTTEVEDSEKADQEARGSLQLLVYALAYREMTGRAPDRLELRYVLTGETGSAPVDSARLEKTKERIRAIAEAIRSRNFEAQPSERTCSICACRPICRESAV
jgi:DNA helicase-2/ATP-dependent DNA helicase PcrA